MLRRQLGDADWITDALRAAEATPRAPEAVAALEALTAVGIAPALPAALINYVSFEYDEAAARFAAVAAGSDREDRAVAWFYLGALAEIAGAPDDAIGLYARSLNEDPLGPLADDSRWWRAVLFEDAGQSAEAAAEYEELAASHASSPFARDAAIRGPLTRATSSDNPGAAAALRDLVASSEPQIAASAARWLRVLQLSHVGDPAPSTLHPTDLSALLDHAVINGQLQLPDAAIAEWSTPAEDWAEATSWLTSRFGAVPSPPPSQDAQLIAGVALVSVGEDAVGRGCCETSLPTRATRTRCSTSPE